MSEMVIEIDEDGRVHGNDLEHALASALNRFCAENASNTPDWILAQYLIGCLAAWNIATQQRDAVAGSGQHEPSMREAALSSSPPPDQDHT